MKQSKLTKHMSYLKIIKKCMKDHGNLALYQGFTVVLLRNCIPGGLLFFVNGKMKEVLGCSQQNNSSVTLFVKRFVSGAVAGLVFWFFAYPFDVIKMRMQNNLKISTISEATKNLRSKRGMIVFRKGWQVSLVRAIPINAINFCMYEYLTKSWNHLE